MKQAKNSFALIENLACAQVSSIRRKTAHNAQNPCIYEPWKWLASDEAHGVLEPLIDLLENKAADISKRAQSKINLGQHRLGAFRSMATCDFASVPFGCSPWDATAKEGMPTRIAELLGRPLL